MNKHRICMCRRLSSRDKFQRQFMHCIIYQMPTTTSFLIQMHPRAMNPLQSSLFEWANVATTLNLIHWIKATPLSVRWVCNQIGFLLTTKFTCARICESNLMRFASVFCHLFGKRLYSICAIEIIREIKSNSNKA